MRPLRNVGYAHKTYGHKGELRISLDYPIEQLTQEDAPFLFLQVMGSSVPYQIEFYENLGEAYRIKFQYIDTPEKAAEYTNAPVFIEEDSIPRQTKGPLPEDFLQYTVINTANAMTIGIVADIAEYPQQIMLMVQSPNDRVHMIPWVDSWLEDIDHEERSISLNLPDGLLDL